MNVTYKVDFLGETFETDDIQEAMHIKNLATVADKLFSILKICAITSVELINHYPEGERLENKKDDLLGSVLFVKRSKMLYRQFFANKSPITDDYSLKRVAASIVLTLEEQQIVRLINQLKWLLALAESSKEVSTPS